MMPSKENDAEQVLVKKETTSSPDLRTPSPLCLDQKGQLVETVPLEEILERKKITLHGIDEGSLPKDDSLPQRESWTNHTEFILSMVGTCVGLGNVWRFPYLCYKNGGGAFLVPYLLAAACAGVPMFLLEVSLGQYYSVGAIKAWGACPPFRGIGIGGIVMCFIANIYYIVVICWVLFYFWHSLTTQLPWASCDNAWNRASCVVVREMPRLSCTTAAVFLTPDNTNNSNYDYSNESEAFVADIAWTTFTKAEFGTSFSSNNSSSVSPAGGEDLIEDIWSPALYWSDVFNYSEINWTLKDSVRCLVNNRWIPTDNITEPVREFWERKVLKISEGLHHIGALNLDMTATLVVCWIICYFCIWKGIRWTGKIVYFTALMPYVLLLVLLVQSLMLPGCTVGLRYFIVPDMAKLAEVDVWLAAVSQVFYSYALGYGTLVTFGSYNNFHSNCYRDSILIAVINSGTSILSGVIVFSVVGFMAHTQNKDVSEVALSGPGLAFLVYPSATLEMPLSSLWSAIFFFTLFMIGLDSEFCFVESLISAITDQYPRQLRPHKELFTAAVCTVSLLLGLSCVTEGGMYVFQLLDAYACSGLCLVYMVFWSSVAMGWFYGADRWLKNIEHMIGYHPGRWWSFCWRYVVPCITLLIFCVNVAMYKPLTYVDYVYPAWGNAVGWLLALASMMWVPFYFIYYVVTAEKQTTLKKNLMYIFRPDVAEEPPEVDFSVI